MHVIGHEDVSVDSAPITSGRRQHTLPKQEIVVSCPEEWRLIIAALDHMLRLARSRKAGEARHVELLRSRTQTPIIAIMQSSLFRAATWGQTPNKVSDPLLG